MLCGCVLQESTSWVEFIMFVFRTSSDSIDRPSRSGQTGSILKQPSWPEPAPGPRKRLSFSILFIPSLTTSVDMIDLTIFENVCWKCMPFSKMYAGNVCKNVCWKCIRKCMLGSTLLQWETAIAVRNDWIFISSEQMHMKLWPTCGCILFPAHMMPGLNGYHIHIALLTSSFFGIPQRLFLLDCSISKQFQLGK
jgi:hypothetical protein